MITRSNNMENEISTIISTSKHDISDVSCFYHPIFTLKLFFKYVYYSITYLIPNKLLLFSLVLSLLLFSIIPIFINFKLFILYTLEWLTLGIISSIGFGTGVPTGMLIVFPHIIKTSILNGKDNIYQTLTELYYPVGLWAFGTALGELPPYLMARMVKMGKLSIHDGISTENHDVITKMQNQMEYIIKKWNFWGILFFASYPNTMFDMCGMACGHFLIPLRTFLSATIIGKVFIKTNAQLHLLVLLPFADHYFHFMSPKYHDYISTIVENIKNPRDYTSESYSIISLSNAWNTIIYLLMLYFLLDFINTAAKLQYVNDSKKNK